MDYPNAKLLGDDWIPQLEDGGLDALMVSAMESGLTGAALLRHLSPAVVGTTPTVDMLTFYLADRWLAGLLSNIALVDGPAVVRTGVSRDAAPATLGNDGTTVWFTTPNSGTVTVRWYCNGVQKVQRAQDVSSDRDATLVELGATIGDIVQVCVVTASVVGWWGRRVLA